MRFHAFHGVGEQEQVVGNTFVVSLKMAVDISAAMVSDNVVDTLSYADVYEEVRDEMSKPSQLLENVAYRIVSRLFTKFATLEGVRIRLDKLNPPMGADISSAGVEIEAER